MNPPPQQRYPICRLPLSFPSPSCRRSTFKKPVRPLWDDTRQSKIDAMFSDQRWSAEAQHGHGNCEPLFKCDDVKDTFAAWEIKACLERTESSPALLTAGQRHREAASVGWDEEEREYGCVVSSAWKTVGC